MAVQGEAGDAVDVGAEGADFCFLKLLQYFVAGMAVAVVESAGDDGPLGPNQGEELRTRGGDAAVMSHF